MDRVYRNFLALKRLAQLSEARFLISWQDRYPCLSDKGSVTDFDRHYVYHTAWAARAVRDIGPKFHVDISSSLYFNKILSAFCPVKFYDYRPANLRLSGLETGPADLLNLPFSDDSIESLSCMHVVEHVGLGRYGDQLDPNGDLKAILELQRVLARGGSLLFVARVGRLKVMFNAHRIYGYDQIVQYFSDLQLHQFALIPDPADKRGLVYQATREDVVRLIYGCGCFWFRKAT